MLKKLFVSMLLGASLFTSMVLWAKADQDAVQVAQLNVNQQLSLSAHADGETSFLNQVGINHKQIVIETNQSPLPMPLSSIIWTMLFGLMFFVVRAVTRRIK